MTLSYDLKIQYYKFIVFHYNKLKCSTKYIFFYTDFCKCMKSKIHKNISFLPSTKIIEHIIIKLLSIFQSDVSSERPGVFNCVTEGVTRLMGMGSTQFTKLIPIWRLLLPTGLVGLSRYIIMQMARYTVITTIQQEEQEKRVSMLLSYVIVLNFIVIFVID